VLQRRRYCGIDPDAELITLAQSTQSVARAVTTRNSVTTIAADQAARFHAGQFFTPESKSEVRAHLTAAAPPRAARAPLIEQAYHNNQRDQEEGNHDQRQLHSNEYPASNMTIGHDDEIGRHASHSGAG
jgi:hypothetical protein